MSGIKVVFDTNTLINFLKGQSSLQTYTNASVIISVISVIEYLSYPQITNEDHALLFSFLKKVEIVQLDVSNIEYIECITALRKSYKIKLPDAVIAATALWRESTLVTIDKDFSKINSLKLSSY